MSRGKQRPQGVLLTGGEPMSERELQWAVVGLLRRAGWVCVVTSASKAQASQIAGLPDVIALKHGRALFIECKSRRGQLNYAQREFAERIAPHVGPALGYGVVRCIEDVAGLVNGTF